MFCKNTQTFTDNRIPNIKDVVDKIGQRPTSAMKDRVRKPSKISKMLKLNYLDNWALQLLALFCCWKFKRFSCISIYSSLGRLAGRRDILSFRITVISQLNPKDNAASSQKADVAKKRVSFTFPGEIDTVRWKIC